MRLISQDTQFERKLNQLLRAIRRRVRSAQKQKHCVYGEKGKTSQRRKNMSVSSSVRVVSVVSAHTDRHAFLELRQLHYWTCLMLLKDTQTRKRRQKKFSFRFVRRRRRTCGSTPHIVEEVYIVLSSACACKKQQVSVIVSTKMPSMMQGLLLC